MARAPRRTDGKSNRAKKPRDAALPDLARFGRLAEYNRKRHFGVTPEPPGTAKEREPGHPLEFVIQKHRASRLHYDFRLDIARDAVVGGSEGPVARPRRQASGDGDRAAPDGLQPVRRRDPGGRVRRRHRDDLGQGRLGSRRRGPARRRAGRRSPAREGRHQDRSARREACRLVGARPHAGHAAMAPHQASRQAREPRGPDDREAAVGRVGPHDGRDREGGGREPPPDRAGRGRRSRHRARGTHRADRAGARSRSAGAVMPLGREAEAIARAAAGRRASRD